MVAVPQFNSLEKPTLSYLTDLPDIFDPAVWQRATPHAAFMWLRQHKPVSQWPHPKEQSPVWVITKHADIVTVLSDPQTFSSRWGVVNIDDLDEAEVDARRTIIEEDPPHHTDLRDTLDPHFSVEAIEKWEGRIRAILDELMDEALKSDTFDFAEKIAGPLPLRVISELFGIEENLMPQTLEAGSKMVGRSDLDKIDPELEALSPDELRTLPFGHPAARAAFDVAEHMAELRRDNPQMDITSALVHCKVDGTPLTDEAFKMNWWMLYISGNETTRHSLTTGLLEMIYNPGEWDRLKQDRSLMDTAVEEILRWSSPVNWHRRQVMTETVLGDTVLQPGDKLALMFASGNRDEEVFLDSFAFDIGRTPNPHVTFGRGGPHYCIGANLARMEIRLVLEALLDRVDSIELAGVVDRVRTNHFNAIKRLPITVTKR